MTRRFAVVLLALGVAACSGSSGPSDSPAPSPSPSVDPAVAVVVDRYGDCLRAIGDSLRGRVLPQSTDAHTYVGFTGRHSVVFSVTHLNGKVYTVPDDRVSARRVSRGGKTC